MDLKSIQNEVQTLLQHLNHHQTLQINVGGSVFQTSLATLKNACKAEPDSVFAKILCELDSKIEKG